MYFLFLTIMFQHTAARRRLQGGSMRSSDLIKVSTHSRAEAAAPFFFSFFVLFNVSTHSRAEAAAAAN